MEPLQWDDRSARCASLLVWFSAWLATSALALEGVASDADVEGPAQVAYAPEGKTGPVVVLISGQSGIEPYKPYAEELAKLGYYAVLLTGKDILNPQLTGEDNLKRAIERALRSPQAKPGKAAVIGFSLGGGGALYNAAPLAELVSVVVVYYPYTKSWVNKINWFANRFQAPILALAAQRDRYMDCCLAETARAIEAAARKNGKSFELVVYPARTTVSTCAGVPSERSIRLTAGTTTATRGSAPARCLSAINRSPEAAWGRVCRS